MTMRERAAAFFEEHYWNSPMSTTEMLVAFAEAEVRAEREALARAADERLLTSSYILSGAHCNPIAALEAENARLLLVHEFAESAAAQAHEHEKLWRDRYADAANERDRLRAERDEAVVLLRRWDRERHGADVQLGVDTFAFLGRFACAAPAKEPSERNDRE